MEPSKVYFTNLRTNPNSNLLDKLERRHIAPESPTSR